MNKYLVRVDEAERSALEAAKDAEWNQDPRAEMLWRRHSDLLAAKRDGATYIPLF